MRPEQWADWRRGRGKRERFSEWFRCWTNHTLKEYSSRLSMLTNTRELHHTDVFWRSDVNSLIQYGSALNYYRWLFEMLAELESLTSLSAMLSVLYSSLSEPWVFFTDSCFALSGINSAKDNIIWRYCETLAIKRDHCWRVIFNYFSWRKIQLKSQRWCHNVRQLNKTIYIQLTPRQGHCIFRRANLLWFRLSLALFPDYFVTVLGLSLIWLLSRC